MPRKKQPKKPARRSPGRSQAAVAEHLDISQQRVAQFVADGTFVALPNGKLDLDDCRLRYIRWLREARKSPVSEDAKRVREARASEIELRLAKELGELIHVEDVKIFFSDTLGVLRSEFTGLPAACSRDPEIRAVIEKETNVRIARCSDAFAGAGERIAAQRPLVLEAEEADA